MHYTRAENRQSVACSVNKAQINFFHQLSISASSTLAFHTRAMIKISSRYYTVKLTHSWFSHGLWIFTSILTHLSWHILLANPAYFFLYHHHRHVRQKSHEFAEKNFRPRCNAHTRKQSSGKAMRWHGDRFHILQKFCRIWRQVSIIWCDIKRGRHRHMQARMYMSE